VRRKGDGMFRAGKLVIVVDSVDKLPHPQMDEVIVDCIFGTS